MAGGGSWKVIFGLAGLVTLALGGALLGIGIHSMNTDDAQLTHLLSKHTFLMTAAILLIVAGSQVVILSLLGCYGMLKESSLLLGAYFCFMLIVFALVVAGAIAGFLLHGDRSEANIEYTMRDTLAEYGRDDTIRASWDYLQEKYHCCGVTSYHDWAQYFPDPQQVPSSCCSKEGSGNVYQCENNPYSPGKYTDPCRDKMVEFIGRLSGLFGGVAIATAVVILIALISVVAVRKSIRL